MRYPDFITAVGVLGDQLRTAPKVHTEDWQGVGVKDNPAASTRELLSVFFTVNMMGHSAESLRLELNPHLPWADEHFEERVGGVPVNPPPSYKRWRHAESSERFLRDGLFDACYPERFWSKNARHPSLTDGQIGYFPHRGFQGKENGDLNNLVELLTNRPLTRRGYMPLFHPEETGEQDRRVMCSTGFWVVNRQDKLHLTYHIRSADFANHFMDDLYLFARLQLWVCEQTKTEPGDFICWVGSLHIFANDAISLWGYP